MADGNLVLCTLEGEIAIISKQGSLLRVLDESSGVHDALVLNAQTDREGGLWLALGNGITRMEMPGPFTRFQEARGINGAIMAVLRHQGKLYMGGDQGLFVRVNAGGKAISPLFVKQENIEGQTWDLLSTPEGLLIANHFGLSRDELLDRLLW